MGAADLPRWRERHLVVDAAGLERDCERRPEHSETMVTWAMIALMQQRLAPAPGRRPWQPSQPR